MNKPDVECIILVLKEKALDFNTLYNHVEHGTIDQYYSSVLAEVASDLLALPVERAYLGLEQLDPTDDCDQVTNAVIEISSVLSNWFLKDQAVVGKDLTNTILNTSAEDIREARFLKLHQMLN